VSLQTFITVNRAALDEIKAQYLASARDLISTAADAHRRL